MSSGTSFSAKWILSSLFASHQKKLRQLLTFQACKLLSDRMTKTILPNYQIAFSGITIIQKLKLGKEDSLVFSCQLEIDHVTQKPKETCQSKCRRPKWTKILTFEMIFWQIFFLWAAATLKGDFNAVSKP